MPSTPATIIERRDDIILVRLQVKDLDEQHTQAVRTDVVAAAAQSPDLPFVLDLSSVKFLPSISLGAVVRLASEFRERKQRLILTNLQPGVRQVMTITRLDRMIEIQEDVDSALKAIRG